MPAGIYTPSQKSVDWLFVYFHDSAEIKINGVLKNLAGGSFVIWSPGMSLYYGNPKTQWTHSWLQCTGAAIPEILEENGLSALLPTHAPHSVLAERYLMRIFMEISNHQEPHQQLLKNTFHNWIIELSRVAQGTDSDRPPEALEAVKHHLDLHFTERIPLSKMAHMSRLSVGHFSTLFHSYYGTSPVDYQIQKRMEYAQYLLEIPNLSITEIGDRTGYSDLYQFSRIFKKRIGTSPSTYRKDRHKPKGQMTTLTS